MCVGGITSQHRKKSLSSDSTFGADSSTASWWWFMDLDARAVLHVGMWGRSDGLMYEVYDYEESNNDVGQLGVLMNVLQGKMLS